MFIMATLTSLPVERPNADRLERQLLVPKEQHNFDKIKISIVLVEIGSVYSMIIIEVGRTNLTLTKISTGQIWHGGMSRLKMNPQMGSVLKYFLHGVLTNLDYAWSSWSWDEGWIIQQFFYGHPVYHMSVQCKVKHCSSYQDADRWGWRDVNTGGGEDESWEDEGEEDEC